MSEGKNRRRGQKTSANHSRSQEMLLKWEAGDESNCFMEK
jgi:hypothetical protein